jgi:glycerate dehydrogenase
MKITYLDEPTFLSDEFAREMSALGEFSVFYDRPDARTAIDRLNDCDVAIVEWTRLTPAILAATTRARYITLVTTGYDFVDLEAAARQGITVAYCPAYSSQAVAEHVFALLLSVSRKVFPGDAAMRRGGTLTHAPFLGLELSGRTMGLIGTGQTARAVAPIAAGFGMKVIGANRSGREVPGVEIHELDAVLARSDFISLHVPLNATTRHLLDARRLNLVKPTCVLVNTCRGDLIDQTELARLLSSGKLAGAGLDHISEVSATEIRALDNSVVVLTPGIAWFTHTSRSRNLDEVHRNVSSYLAGTPRNVISRPQNRITGMSVVTDEFVPPDFNVPLDLRRGRFTLVPLSPDHNVQDYDAWTSSVDHINRTPGFTDYPWPYPMSPDDNLLDLKQHADDFKKRRGFTYTTMIDGEIAGCVYIYPIKDKPGHAAVRSWVRQDHAELDTDLYGIVRKWLKDDWPFDDIEYSER